MRDQEMLRKVSGPGHWNDMDQRRANAQRNDYQRQGE